MEQSKEIIRPGMPFDILDQNRHMKSMAYDVIGHRIIIAQTAPPLNNRHLNREVLLTFLVKKEGKSIRYGISAKITDFITNYRLVSSEVTAVGLEQKSGLDTFDLRLDYRVRPQSDSKLGVEWKGQKLSIVDISIGGFQFSYRGKDAPAIKDELKLALSIDDYSVKVSAVPVKIARPVPQEPDLIYVGAKFIGNRLDYERQLMKKVLEIQRKQLMEGKLG